MADPSLVLIGLTFAAGYILKKTAEPIQFERVNKQGSYKKSDDSFLISDPNGMNIYTSNTVNEITKQELDLAFENYRKAQDPSVTSIIPPNFEMGQFGGLGGDLYGRSGTTGNVVNQEGFYVPTAEKQADINNYNKLASTFGPDRAQLDIKGMPMFNSTTPAMDQVEQNFSTDLGTNQGEINPLTGLAFERSHSNMQPMFGSTIKQNIEPLANTTLLGNYTGISDTWQPKREQAKMFPNVQQDLSHRNLLDYIDRDRYIPSRERRNEKPFEPIREQRFKESSIEIPQIRGKTIDELRGAFNPKIEYLSKFNESGRIGQGQYGTLGKVEYRGKQKTRELDFVNYLGGQSVNKQTYFDQSEFQQKRLETGEQLIGTERRLNGAYAGTQRYVLE